MSSISTDFHDFASWKFVFRQIILVNSGKYCYVKVPLSEHICLLGANNGGKTSILNALKFFLLPEENLHDCERKFGFKNPNGFYSRDSSYAFYFPEPSSFVILEAENHHGPFCIVLNRGGKPFSYERTGVPCGYQDIEHLFWDVKSPLNDGQGAPVRGLSIQSVAAKLKTMHGEPIRDSATIRERLYRHQPTRPQEGRYCLLPLKSGGARQREIDAWKRLIHLSFDISAKDRRTLPDTIATIIEGRKARPEAEVKVDFADILQRYKELHETQDRLQTIKNGQRFWSAYDEHFGSLSTRSDALLNLLLDAQEHLQQVKARQDEVYKSLAAEYSTLDERYQKAQKEAERLCERFNRCQGELDQTRKNYERSHKELLALGAARAGYGDKSLEEILQIRVEANEQAKRDLQTCEDQEKLRCEFQQANSDKNRLQSELARVEQWLNSRTETLLDRLIPAVADPLYSLNQQAFSVECKQLDASTQEIIEHFAGLFSIQESGLQLLGKPTGVPSRRYSVAELLDRQQGEQVRLTKELSRVRERYVELSQRVTMTQEQLQQQAIQLRERIDKDDKDIRLLRAGGRIEEGFEQCKRDHDEANEKLECLQKQSEEANKESSKAKAKRDETESTLKRAKEGAGKAMGWSERIGNLLQVPLLESFLNAFQRAESQALEVDQTLIDRAEKQSRELEKLYQDAKERLSELMDAVPLNADSPEQAHRAAYPFGELRRLHNDYAVLYARLPAEEETFFNRVVAHNGDTNIQVDQIRACETLITGFIKEIEAHLESVPISNIAQIRILCSLHPQFKELLGVLDKVNMSGGELPPKELYERLGNFLSQFFESRDLRLNLARLIEAVEYRVRLQGRDDFKAEAQSTGTSVMINIRVLAFLLKELLQSDSRVAMPLLIDEISQLDTANLKAARSIAEADGFCLFGATPELTPAVANVLGRFMNLSYFEAVDETYNNERTVIFTGQCESLVLTDPGQEMAAVTRVSTVEEGSSTP